MNIDKLIVPEGCHDLTIREGSTPDPLPLYNYQGFRKTRLSLPTKTASSLSSTTK